jgi:hypothetical protein
MSPTRFTVVATDQATDELTTIWLNNPSEKGAITKASVPWMQYLLFVMWRHIGTAGRVE